MIEGTVIEGTARNQDLIPTFIHLLSEVAPHAYEQLMSCPFPPIPAYVVDEGGGSEWWESEDAYALLEALMDELDHYADEGYYFGAHPDAADFGYWKFEEY